MIQCPRCQRKVQGLCVNDGYTPDKEFSRPDFEVCADCKPLCEAVVAKRPPEASVVLRSITTTVEDHYWDKITKCPDTGCWYWDGARGGRKRRPLLRNGKKLVDAVRYSYELRYGPLPAGAKVRNVCPKPGCLNPKHLTITSASKENPK